MNIEIILNTSYIFAWFNTGKFNALEKHIQTNDIEVYWTFPQNKVIVSQEYLVYDYIGMIGSVGGTLGLFLGFSFLDLIYSLINYLLEKFGWWKKFDIYPFKIYIFSYIIS